MKILTTLLLTTFCYTIYSLAQTPHQYISDQKVQHRWLSEYRNFLSIPKRNFKSMNDVEEWLNQKV